jgi:hypothetical protein
VRINPSTQGKTLQNSPLPQESTRPPARSIASQKGSAERTKILGCGAIDLNKRPDLCNDLPAGLGG